jgi:hypothetical protein
VQNPDTVRLPAPTLHQAAVEVARSFQHTAVSGIAAGADGLHTIFAGTHIHISLTLPPKGAGPEALWQADLATGAVAELVNNGAPGALCNGLGSSVLTGTTAQGKPVPTIPTQEITPNAPANQHFAAASKSSAQIIRSVTHTVSEFGLRVASLRVIDADGPALDLAVIVPNANQLTQHLVVTLNAAFKRTDYVGVYLEFRDVSGTALVGLDESARSSSGGQWIQPGLKMGYPYAHG